jgi:hypothetical protein
MPNWPNWESIITDPYGTGVEGDSQGGIGVLGQSDWGTGVRGTSRQFDGVQGQSASTDHAGLSGVNDSGGFGVWARGSPAGHFETNADTDALFAITSSPNHAAVSANNTSQGNGSVPSGFALWASANATAIYGRGNPAAYFEGDVLVTGDVVLVNSPGSGDIAEDFDVDDEKINLEPGTVLVINEQGRLCASSFAYDTRVAGVVSGAGELRPAVVLQRVSSPTPRSPIALLGKVFCKVDATFGGIAAGDLLTTSSRRGYAMKACDRSRALGAIIGKALASLSTGAGTIPIMVSLR